MGIFITSIRWCWWMNETDFYHYNLLDFSFQGVFSSFSNQFAHQWFVLMNVLHSNFIEWYWIGLVSTPFPETHIYMIKLLYSFQFSPNYSLFVVRCALSALNFSPHTTCLLFVQFILELELVKVVETLSFLFLLSITRVTQIKVLCFKWLYS